MNMWVGAVAAVKKLGFSLQTYGYGSLPTGGNRNLKVCLMVLSRARLINVGAALVETRPRGYNKGSPLPRTPSRQNTMAAVVFTKYVEATSQDGSSCANSYVSGTALTTDHLHQMTGQRVHNNNNNLISIIITVNPVEQFSSSPSNSTALLVTKIVPRSPHLMDGVPGL